MNQEPTSIILKHSGPIFLRTEYFTSKDIVVATESPPTPLASDAFRRVDFHVSIFNRFQKLQIVAICEIKRSRGAIDDVEAQLQEACEACVKHTKEDVWGIAIIGTKAQVFQYTAKNRFFTITAGYIEANSPQASALDTAFRNINNAITKPAVADGWYDAGDGSGRHRYFKDGAWMNQFNP
ncbi:hypothetical protein EKO04_006700 [Ascochyta lentis]|uniref:Uncharacterized protein n=1 Tax=Ascochyta lentis TaxID=205686 RepID=A0A8H7IYI8_9PLEO|nr:hypothetical protein EKO04_006700 [Ascochyta lentis]